MTMEPPWGPGWFLISEAPYRPRAPHQSPWDSSTGWNQPCRSRPCLIKGGCDNGCIGISLGTQWLFKINLIKSHDGLTIQISKWWYIWYVHGILVVLRGFSIHIWWGSTISGCERIVDCTGRVDLTQLLACCSQKGYALTANFMEHLPWFIDTFPSIYIYQWYNLLQVYIYIYTCTCKINPNSCSHGTSGILQPCKHTMQLCMVLPHLLWKAKYSISNYVLIPGSNRA